MITPASSIDEAIALMQPAVENTQKTLGSFFSTNSPTAPTVPDEQKIFLECCNDYTNMSKKLLVIELLDLKILV